MCGITAISRVLDRSSIGDPRQFMRLAALAIEPRGKDATGFAWTRRNGNAFYWKTPQRAQDAVAVAPFDKDMLNVIGHTRWKTQGPATDNRNNHPVIDDGIMLVHNGTVDNDWELYRWLGRDFKPKADVDSQVIATLMVNKDALYAEGTTDVLEVLEGSAALAWIETDMPEILHLARVKDRPLTLGWTRRGDMVMSSTPQTLNNLSVWSNVRLRDVWEVPEGRYITVQEGEIVNVEQFKPKRTYTTGGYGYGRVSKYTPHPTTTTTTAQTLLSHDKPADAKGADVVPFDDRKAREEAYEAWWASQLEREAAELDAALADDPDPTVGPISGRGDERFIDDQGMTWIPIWDGDEVVDYVILDEYGVFVALANSDDFAIEAEVVADTADTVPANA